MEDILTLKIKELVNTIPVLSSFLLYTVSEKEKSTRYSYGEELKLFFLYLISYNPLFCDKELNEITNDDLSLIKAEDISLYLSLLLDNGLKDKTVARKRASISSFFTFMCNNKKIKTNPVSMSTKVKIHTSDDVIHLTIPEQLKFLNDVFSGENLDKKKKAYHEKYALRDKAIIIMLLDTGLRNSELRGINISDVNFTECSVFIKRKGGSFQTIYFSDETKKVILEYLSYRKNKQKRVQNEEPLFTTLKGDRLSSSTLEKLIKKYALSSFPGKGKLITPHKMRSSSAMSYYAKTKDILALQRKLGHKNIQTTNIYAKATNEEMKANRNIFNDLFNKK